jgi:HPt (histidine-containing phosphotransfer) domain-containing protein
MTKKKTRLTSDALDVNFLQTITDGDIEFEKELFTTFIDSCTSNIEKMKDSVKNKDTNSWRMSSHSFKGASASIGAFDLAAVLETAQTHKEDDYKGKTKIIAEVEEKFVIVADFLNERLATNG